jgi:hypothetical protein
MPVDVPVMSADMGREEASVPTHRRGCNVEEGGADQRGPTG